MRLSSFLLCLTLYASLATPAVNAANETMAPTTAPNATTAVSTAVRTAVPTAGGTNTSSTVMPTTSDTPSQLVNSSNDFAISLYKAISEISVDENIFMSPISISYGLAMLYAAAGGKTRSQLGTAMRLAANADQSALGKDFRTLVFGLNRNTTKYALQLASCMFIHKDFRIRDAFLKTMNESFGVATESLDFEVDPDAAKRLINGWVANRTSGKLMNIFGDDSITEQTTFVLANTAFFHGFWLYAFDKNSTKTGKFSVSSKRTTSVAMMKQRSTREMNYYNSSELAAQVLELPYSGLFASMYVFLPHNVEGLTNLEDRLTSAVLGTVLTSLNEERVLVTMPKFAMDRGTSLMKALVKLGVVDLFDSAKSDLSGFDGSKRRAMTDIVHKAVVSVDEDGKVSAAMPVMGITVTVESIPFDVNRPFLFLVADKATGSILFMGRVTKP